MAFLEGNYSCPRPVWESINRKLLGGKKPKAENYYLNTSVLLWACFPEGSETKLIIYMFWLYLSFDVDKLVYSWALLGFDVYWNFLGFVSSCTCLSIYHFGDLGLKFHSLLLTWIIDWLLSIGMSEKPFVIWALIFFYWVVQSTYFLQLRLGVK